jgi:membrane protease YdiL (CAAX protease family)
MTEEIISALLQVLAFSLVPLLVYLAVKRKFGGFFNYIGLYKSPKRANLLAALASLIFILGAVGLVLISDEFRNTLHNPETMTGKFKAMGFQPASVTLILVTAWIKTALSEEILFRGFIAKRLISMLGFTMGNILQALIFGLVHVGLFLALKSNIGFLLFIGAFSSIGAFVSCYINEKIANGSIVPGWISHGLANTVSYLVIGFVL